MNDATARRIYQQLLDDIDRAIDENDAEAYAAFFSLPHRFETYEKSILITTQSQLKSQFEKLLKRLGEMSVDGLTRQCTSASFLDDCSIRGWHETKLINTGLTILESYICLSTLTLSDGIWTVADSQYAEPEASLPTLIAIKGSTNEQ